jgi:hypothetical protein
MLLHKWTNWYSTRSWLPKPPYKSKKKLTTLHSSICQYHTRQYKREKSCTSIFDQYATEPMVIKYAFMTLPSLILYLRKGILSAAFIMIVAHQKRLPEVQRTRFPCTTITVGARSDIINYQSCKTVSYFPGIMRSLLKLRCLCKLTAGELRKFCPDTLSDSNTSLRLRSRTNLSITLQSTTYWGDQYSQRLDRELLCRALTAVS